ncbi:MAG: hypothetical protein IJP32_08155 [Clostridia bacterium]|nr:hypothetical protein [Clostridia bacterium]
MTDILTFCGAGLFAVFAVSVIRELRKEYTVSVVLAVCVLFFLHILPKIGESVQFIREISAGLEASHVNVILRALGITYLTGTAGEICRSAGEAAVGGYIELAGRIEIMLLCLPLFRELTELAFL